MQLLRREKFENVNSDIIMQAWIKDNSHSLLINWNMIIDLQLSILVFIHFIMRGDNKEALVKICVESRQCK
jgi:hypothetical protein